MVSALKESEARMNRGEYWNWDDRMGMARTPGGADGEEDWNRDRAGLSKTDAFSDLRGFYF
jgi:hypothetical protein